MIWYDARTLEPVAPGACEDGGAPSINFIWCQNCQTERGLKYLKGSIGSCVICMEPILVRG